MSFLRIKRGSTRNNGSKFDGDVKNSMRHGQGVFTLGEKNYSGEWKDGLFHGYVRGQSFGQGSIKGRSDSHLIWNQIGNSQIRSRRKVFLRGTMGIWKQTRKRRHEVCQWPHLQRAMEGKHKMRRRNHEMGRPEGGIFRSMVQQSNARLWNLHMEDSRQQEASVSGMQQVRGTLG